MAKVSNGAESLPKISNGSVGCTNVTDRQTTDGRTTAYREREREFTFAKNDVVVKLTYSLSLLLHCAKISNFHCQPETSAGCRLGLEATTLCTSIFYIEPG